MNDIDINKAVEYIFAEPKKHELKIKVVEGANGVYNIEGTSVRLERKNAYVLFENETELNAWCNEFKEVFKFTR